MAEQSTATFGVRADGGDQRSFEEIGGQAVNTPLDPDDVPAVACDLAHLNRVHGRRCYSRQSYGASRSRVQLPCASVR